MKLFTLILTALITAIAQECFALPPDRLEAPSLYFMENNGQVTDQFYQARCDIQYSIEGPGMTLFIGNGELHYQFSKPGSRPAASMPVDFNRSSPVAVSRVPISMYRLDVMLIGANKNARVVTGEAQTFVGHYYLSHCGQGVHVRSYRKLTYQDIYPHIDWVIYTKDGQLEYDFLVKEGGNPADIRLQYSGTTGLTVAEDGSLLASTPMGTVREHAPVSYMEKGAAVNSSFVLESNIVSFKVAAYKGMLTIDPTLQWATYYGGANYDLSSDVVTDSSGNVFIAGDTESTSNIATTGSHQMTIMGNQDAFLVMFSPAGVRQWATYFGGPGDDPARGLSLDGNGHIFMSGFTASTTGIATPGSHQPVYGGGLFDAYLVQFSTSGVRQWATYHGGPGREFGESPWQNVAADKDGNVYLYGLTASTTGIATPGSHQPALAGLNDCFLVKFNGAGTRQWATYYGGPDNDRATGIATDHSGNVYVTGSTLSTSGIAASGSFQTLLGGNGVAGRDDNFLVKFNASGVRQWATYYGGPDYEFYPSVASDDSDNIYMAGITYSDSSIATPGSHQAGRGGEADAYLVKFDTWGVRQWATFYGGYYNEGGGATSLATDGSGNVYLGGGTESPNWIATPGSYQTAQGGGSDVFLAKFTRAGARLWGSYIGGPLHETAFGLACDGYGHVYCAGSTQSTSGIAAAGSFQVIHGGGLWDAFLIKLSGCAISHPIVNRIGATLSSISTYTGYQWFFNGVPIAGATAPSYMVTQNGAYYLQATNGPGCTDTSNTIRVSGLSVPDLPHAAAIHLYPNPGSGVVHIDAPGNVNVVIRNAEGKTTVYLRDVNEFNLEACPPGLYLVSIYSLNGAWIKNEKIVRSR